MWTAQSYFEVAVWWPRGGSYGNSERHATVEGAIAERDHLLSLGYKNVHMRKVTITVNKETMTEEPYS